MATNLVNSASLSTLPSLKTFHTRFWSRGFSSSNNVVKTEQLPMLTKIFKHILKESVEFRVKICRFLAITTQDGLEIHPNHPMSRDFKSYRFTFRDVLFHQNV